MPLQNMSQFTGCVVTDPVAGSKIPAWKFVFPATLPDPETIRTLPLCSSAECTGLMGIRFGSVCHCPCVLAWAAADGTHASENRAIATMTTRGFARYVERSAVLKQRVDEVKMES